MVALPELGHGLSGTTMGLLVAGGILYTVGAVVLATKRPDPRPRVFGYHEVWALVHDRGQPSATYVSIVLVFAHLPTW